MLVFLQPENLRCCSQPDWRPRVYTCASCGTKVEGNFARGEFSGLTSDELHFLRIFLWAEGRIKDMEGPLGMSYPTIRSRLSELRSKLFEDSEKLPPSSEVKTDSESKKTILDLLSKKEITFDEAMKRLSKICLEGISS